MRAPGSPRFVARNTPVSSWRRLRRRGKCHTPFLLFLYHIRQLQVVPWGHHLIPPFGIHSHSVNDASFIPRVVADSTFGFVYAIHKTLRRFWQTSTRMNLRYCAGDRGDNLSGILDKVSRASGLSFEL